MIPSLGPKEISNEFFSRERAKGALFWSLLLLWLGLVLYVSVHHELWRDEVHCLYVALSAENLWDLPAALKNEGHPILWYLILWLGYHATQTPLILKISGIAIGFWGVFLFLRYAPFPLWFSALFIFGFLPLYEYSVMARNYGISMLLFFLAAHLVARDKVNMYLVGVVLFLLANTNIHSAIFVGSLALYLGHRCCFATTGKGRYREMAVFALLVISGLLFCLLTILPDQESVVKDTASLSVSQILTALIQTIQNPGQHFNEIFVGLPPMLHTVLVVVLSAGLLVVPIAALSSFLGLLVLGLFFSIGYDGVLRHQGIYLLYMLTMYWLVWFQISLDSSTMKPWAVRLFKAVLFGVFPLIFVIHIAGSHKYIQRDLRYQMSSSKAFGEFIAADEQLHQAIIVGEPDIRLESLPYYRDNDIYVPREGKYKKFVKLTRDNAQELSLRQLLAVAKTLREEHHRPILIALGHFGLDQQPPPYIRTEQYGKTFTWTSEELDDFIMSTTKLAEFKEDVKNERYEVYLLK